MNNVAGEIHRYIVDRFLFGQGGDRLTYDTSFLEQELIDSTGILELMMFIEERFGIRMQDDELVPDNLDSVNRIARFVERKTAR